MDRVWRVVRDGSESGPFTVADLHRMVADGRLRRTDLIRKDGMPDWRPAGDARGLFPGAAPVPSPPPTTAAEGDSTGGLIPYKNPNALIAYYTGIFLSPFCFVGLGIVPLVFGILGLRDRKKNPVIKGSVHAWIGIVLGSLSLLFTGGIVVLVIISLITRT